MSIATRLFQPCLAWWATKGNAEVWMTPRVSAVSSVDATYRFVGYFVNRALLEKAIWRNVATIDFNVDK